MMNDFNLLVDLIGLQNALLFIENYGGISYSMPKGDCERANRLRSIMGNEVADILMRYYAGERVYIPQFNEIVNVQIYQAFVNDVRQAMAGGMSKAMALEIFCPRYKISDRYAYNLLSIKEITYENFCKKYKKNSKENESQLNFDFGVNWGKSGGIQ